MRVLLRRALSTVKLLGTSLVTLLLCLLFRHQTISTSTVLLNRPGLSPERLKWRYICNTEQQEHIYDTTQSPKQFPGILYFVRKAIRVLVNMKTK